MRHPLLRLLSLALVVSPLLAGGLRLGLRDAVALDVVGNTYTSPTYGYTLAWDDSWVFIDEDSEGREDVLVLTNGATLFILDAWLVFASFITPQECATSYGDSLADDASNADVQPMLDDEGTPMEGGDAYRYHAAYTYTYTPDSGEAVELVDYAECRIVIVERAMLRIVASTPAGDYATQAPLVQDLLAGLVIPSPGEPGPVFVDGRWRIALVAAARGERLYAAGLERSEEGKDWLVVVADVTNWGRDEAVLAVDDFAIQFDGIDESSGPVVEEIAVAAAALGIEPNGSETRILFAEGETIRVPLVFQVPHAGTTPVLIRAKNIGPLAGVLGANLQDLRPVITPPPLREARVIDVLDGVTLKVRMVDGDATETVMLDGIDAPLLDECYGAEAASRLARLAGDTVWLEGVGALADNPLSEHFVWVERPNGARVLLNRQLVAEGYAALGEPSWSDRFVVWLDEAEATALANARGLWGACSGPHEPA